jgi:hypothetical protein
LPQLAKLVKTLANPADVEFGPTAILEVTTGKIKKLALREQYIGYLLDNYSDGQSLAG